MLKPKISIKKVTHITPSLLGDVIKLKLCLYETSTISVCRKWLNKLLNFPSASFFVARILPSEQIIGMLTLISYPTIGDCDKTWIEDVVVAEEARGKGVGKKLMEVALKEAKKQGAKDVRLTSKPSRIAANHLYQKLGFEKYETNYYKIKIK